jgi:predicted histidine transporter YuiF (NhaC family)
VAVQYNPLSLLVAGVAIAAAFIVQLLLDSMIIGALVGFLIFSVSGIVAGATPMTCSPKA